MVDAEARFQSLDDGGIDGQRQVGEGLHQLHGLGQDGGLIGQRNAGVDVQHMGAGRDLGQAVGLDPGEVAGGHLGGQQLAAGRIDPLADDAEGLIEADHQFPGMRADDRT